MKDPPTSGTEEAFHGDWDANIRSIIEVCVPGGISQRNSHIATREVRPDYTYCIGEACPFRGEEESPETFTEDPRRELANNLVWMFGVTPYILGYYAKGTCVTLVALTAPQSGGNVGIHDLVRVDLSSWRGRIQNIVHLLNLSTFLDPLSQLMDRSGPEFLRLERDTCTIEFTSFVIVKTFRDSAKAKRLCALYDLIVANNVPNTDHVSYSSGNIVHLKPRGSAFRPRTVPELYERVRCVLEALVVAHRILLYHRNIRPENVIRKIDNPSKWFLVGWEDAASGPRTLAQPHFASETHCPDVFHDDHGPEVDIWGVGLLTEECCRFAGRPLSKFGQSLQKQAKELTATAALQQLHDIYNNLPALWITECNTFADVTGPRWLRSEDNR
ncbi:hypothetical protein FA13DRAFT_1793022 [Coprinellus micaceus]|uniref:Protein kinase domain-containing protein n=1 Tax=Coprinellus micaceus TaxID=71717 RepID=A0A4Y7T6W3_COPMI|nr:hypothetical protein FA13DRAFT_1793022 [Coprinellus micaceus]